MLTVAMEHGIDLPLLCHVIGIPQGGKTSGQWFQRFDLWESGSFRHFPSDKCNQNDQPAIMEVVPQVLGLTTILLYLFDEVILPVHLHALYTLSCEVHHEPSDLCGESSSLLSFQLRVGKRGTLHHLVYILPFNLFSFFYFCITFLDVYVQRYV
jgi:hypothetical protein